MFLPNDMSAPTSHSSQAPIHPNQHTPLLGVLAFTFLNSIGSAVVYAGVFFLAKSQYGFSEQDNFLLALVYGVTYIPAALGIGPLLRRLARAGISPRAVLGFIMVTMAAMCVLPYLASLGEMPGQAAAARARWPIWVAVSVYSPLSGALWPIVESFLAGGRSEGELRTAIGRFNICWSSALVVTLLAMSPLVDKHALVVLNALSVVHLSCAALLVVFAPRPGRHAEHHSHTPPLRYHQLLSVLRILLPTAFLFISALSPYIPAVLSELKVKGELVTVVAATWYAARVATFFWMERWHGWHGSWSTPIAGLVFLGVSFGVVVLSPLAGVQVGLGVLLIGLVGFGIGVGIIYAAALYYAMEVGSDGVDAGGMHETLIGIGYSVGPLCGLLAGAAVKQGVVGPERFQVVMLGLVTGLAVLVSGYALLRARGHARS
jgi:hypothetical protein